MNRTILIAAAMLLAACSGRKAFTVEIDNADLGSQQLTVEYTAGGGQRVWLNPTVIDGAATFSGQSPEGAHVEIYLSNGALYREFMARDGDRITITADTILGLTLALEPRPATPDTTTWMPSPEVIVARDSATRFPIGGVWVFTASERERTAALLDTLRSYGAKARDIYTGHSFDDWYFMVRHDSATWPCGLLVDAPLAVEALTTTPMLIETDSTGRIIRRTTL